MRLAGAIDQFVLQLEADGRPARVDHVEIAGKHGATGQARGAGRGGDAPRGHGRNRRQHRGREVVAGDGLRVRPSAGPGPPNVV